MRIAPARAAAPILAVLASLMALPAQAAEPAVSLTVNQRWENVAAPGSWAPYTANIKNEGGSDFSGDLLLVANEALNRGVRAGTYPDYRAHVTVQKGTEKAVTIFVIQAPANYRAELRDLGGHVLANADLSSTTSGGLTLGMLSDQHNAEQRIPGYRPLAQTQLSISHFASPAAFPTSAVYLSGLNAVLIDDFDSAALSQAQVQSLKDFVGLGGSLIVAGGPSWRRTMLPLPAELAPLHPSASASVSLQPLADLDDKVTTQTAQVAVGEVKGQVLLGAPGAPPLVVGTRYGSGHVIDLAYDPLAEPFASVDPGLGSVAFSQALARALLDQSPTGRGFGPGPMAGVPGGGALKAAQPGGGVAAGGATLVVNGPGGQPTADQVSGILGDTPVAALPPIALLGALLLGYVLLVGPFNYLLMRLLGRRELLWATVPAVSLLFTVAAYAVGFGSRGSDFVDNEVQILRLAPEGTVQTQGYYGIYSPHKGDYSVRFPSNTLVSTLVVLGAYGGGDTALIDLSGKPEVQIQGAAVWSMRTVQSLSISRQPIAVETHLSRSGPSIVGSITNRGQRSLGTIWAVNGVGDQAELASSLVAGQTVQVDQELNRTAGSATTMSPNFRSTGPPGTAASYSDGSISAETKRATVLRLAASTVMSSDPYEFALVGLTSAPSNLQINGARMTRYSIAAAVMPVRLEGVDALGASPPARLVSTVQRTPIEYVDTYDLAIPTGMKGRLDLVYPTPFVQKTLPVGAMAPVQSGPIPLVQVYDWSAGTWRPLPPWSSAGGSPTGPIQTSTRDGLRPGEIQNGLVRVRVHEANAGLAQASLRLSDAANQLGSGGGSG
jgi:hypothetical protein